MDELAMVPEVWSIKLWGGGGVLRTLWGVKIIFIIIVRHLLSFTLILLRVYSGVFQRLLDE